MRAYFLALEDLSRRLARHLALALGLPDDWFADKLDRHASQLRLLHYPAPARELEPGQLRCGVHTDLGMMTILRNEAAAGGLQVRPRGGDWIDAPAIDDTFVVNIGDLLMRWTNDRWVSTPHRVAVPEAEARSRSRRLSIGYFTRPNYDRANRVHQHLPGCREPGALRPHHRQGVQRPAFRPRRRPPPTRLRESVVEERSSRPGDPGARTAAVAAGQTRW